MHVQHHASAISDNNFNLAVIRIYFYFSRSQFQYRIFFLHILCICICMCVYAHIHTYKLKTRRREKSTRSITIENIFVFLCPINFAPRWYRTGLTRLTRRCRYQRARVVSAKRYYVCIKASSIKGFRKSFGYALREKIGGNFLRVRQTPSTERTGFVSLPFNKIINDSARRTRTFARDVSSPSCWRSIKACILCIYTYCLPLSFSPPPSLPAFLSH